MPLIPYITDKGELLNEMFSTFSQLGVHYLFASSITLFGKETSSSKKLILRAIEKHYPELNEKYNKFFDTSDYMPAYYQKALAEKVKQLGDQYFIPNRI
jgi:hypothetical protein